MQQARRATVEPFPPRKQERSIGTLFSDLARETSLLIRQEIALARAEIAQGATALGAAFGVVAAGALVAFAGLLALLAAAILGLSKIVEPWLAALIVGGVVILLGVALVFIGKSKIDMDRLAPRRTIRSLKDDAQWAKEQVG